LSDFILQTGRNGVILSTDVYFTTPRGYFFDPSLLADAHEWNKRRAEECLRKGDILILDCIRM